LRCQAIATSSHTGAGLEALQRAIYQSLTADRNDSEVVAGTAIRCGDSLRRAAAAVRLAQQAVPGGEPDAGKLANARKLADDQQVGGDELVAAELRLALDELAQVVGAVYTEDILDRIFSRFCIGK
jgi:tRNA modification GTPase